MQDDIREHEAPEESNTLTRLDEHQPAILVVDDSRQICTALQRELSDLGRSSHCFQSPDEAIDLLSNPDIKIDIALVDLVLKEHNGLELLEYLAKHRPEVRRILISGRVEYSLLEKIHVMGTVHAVLPKPWDPARLAKALAI